MQDNPPGQTSSEDGSDNHLRLNPSNPEWSDAVESWEDGKTYVFKDVEVRQISPGEYQVIKATPGPAVAAEGAPEPEGEPAGAMGDEEMGEPNPAMRKLMRAQKA